MAHFGIGSIVILHGQRTICSARPRGRCQWWSNLPSRRIIYNRLSGVDPQGLSASVTAAIRARYLRGPYHDCCIGTRMQHGQPVRSRFTSLEGGTRCECLGGRVRGAPGPASNRQRGRGFDVRWRRAEERRGRPQGRDFRAIRGVCSISSQDLGGGYEERVSSFVGRRTGGTVARVSMAANLSLPVQSRTTRSASRST